MKKKIAFWMIAAIVICLAAAALFWKNGEGEASVFTAAILEIHDGCYLVEPSEGSAERTSADRIEVPIQSAAPSPEPQVGDTIEIEYSGVLLETYPAQIADVYAIRVTAQAERWDLIPMVMVDGTLYLDTGHNSTATARCGMLDGKITSSVDSASKPTKDDQSNFGAGYGYQYGAEEGTIEVFLNGKWRVFATEEVRNGLAVDGTEGKRQEPPSEDLLAIFHRCVEEGKTADVTDYVYAEDKAYGLDGVVQYEDDSGCPWKLAFIRGDSVNLVSQEWGTDCEVVSELTYLGEGKVQATIKNRATNAVYVCTMKYTYDAENNDTNFESASKEVKTPEENTPLTVDSISVLNLTTQKQKEITAAADIHTILTVVSGEWENGMPACDSDMKITLGTEDYWYHSDCGTFLDTHNNRSISLSGEERAEIDRILTE